MNKLFFIILLISSSTLLSQKLFFNKLNYSDTVSFEKNISELAKKALKVYNSSSSDKDTYYDNLFRMQLVAKEYSISLKYLDSVSKNSSSNVDYQAIIGVAYKVYCKTMLELTDKTMFDVLFQNNLRKLYFSCSDKLSPQIKNYFLNPISGLRLDVNNLKSSLSKNNSDSITLPDAVLLCRKQLSYLIYSKTNTISLIELEKLDKEKYNIQDSVLITMPDGGTVSATIIRKSSFNKPMPVVMMYNIYAGSSESMAKEIANENYVGVIVNTRGKYVSKNTIEPFEHDANDAYYAIDWISKQSWCNGSIGMFGGSYLGFSQWSATKKLHPALKTIVPQVSVGVGIDYPICNGVFMNYMLPWIHYVSNNKTIDGVDFADSKKWSSINDSWYKSGARFKSLDSLNGEKNPIFQKWLQHPTYDSFWQNMTPQKNEYTNINIPILTITGYFDDDQLGAMYYYKQHHLWNKNPNHYLLIGPYDHGGAQGYPSTIVAGYKIDSVADIPINDIVFRWFDYILKDGIKPEILKDKVNFEIMGSNTWKHVPSIKNMCNDTLTFYLDNTKQKNTYNLSTQKNKTLRYISETVDFNDRTTLVKSDHPGFDIPLLIDSVIHHSERKLVFVSNPFTESITFSAAIQASIQLNINKKDVDVVFDVYELNTKGKYFQLTLTNIQRASLAKDKSVRQLLKPNTIENIALTNTFMTSKKIEKGSKLIVVIGVNKNPDWQLNYGTGKDVSDETLANDGKEPLLIKWYNTSTIKVPILK
jgi:putative CocE/NonD family hydrolase